MVPWSISYLQETFRRRVDKFWMTPRCRRNSYEGRQFSREISNPTKYHALPVKKTWIYQVPQLKKLRLINKSTSNSIRCYYQQICSKLGRPETILKIREEVTLLEVINKPVIYKFFKVFTNHRENTSRMIAYSSILLSNIFKYHYHR